MGIGILYTTEAFLPQAEKLAAQLGLQLQLKITPEEHLALEISADGLTLTKFKKARRQSLVKVDFDDPKMLHRLKYGNEAGGLLARAIGLDIKHSPAVIDATAGLGRDAFVIASLGARVTLIEKHPIINALLADGFQRAATSEQAAPAIGRMQLINYDALQVFQEITNGLRAAPDVIYLDPMFPERSKSASVKKDLAFLQAVLNDTEETSDLLKSARQVAGKRVVVKRPRQAPFLESLEPNHQISGKVCRYDIYLGLHKPKE